MPVKKYPFVNVLLMKNFCYQVPNIIKNKHQNYYEFLGLAVYATPENIEKYKENIQTDTSNAIRYSSPTAPKVSNMHFTKL